MYKFHFSISSSLGITLSQTCTKCTEKTVFSELLILELTLWHDMTWYEHIIFFANAPDLVLLITEDYILLSAKLLALKISQLRPKSLFLPILNENSHVLRPTLAGNGWRQKYFTIFPVYLVMLGLTQHNCFFVSFTFGFYMIFKRMVCVTPIGSHVKFNTGPMGKLNLQSATPKR